MEKNINISGYDLYEITKDEWILNVRSGPLHVGTFKDVVKLAVTKLRFSLEEVEFAVKEMIRTDHNAAHFGVQGSFIHTFHKDFNEKKAS